MGRLRRVAIIVAFLMATLGATAVLAPAAEARTTSFGPHNRAWAMSWGMTCDATHHWIRQNYPTIYPASRAIQEVAFRSYLLRKNAKGAWYIYRYTGYRIGVGNVYGQYRIGNFLTPPFTHAAGWPYKWAIPGRPSLVAEFYGPAFLNLPHGVYTTVEEYHANGVVWDATNQISSGYVNNPHVPYTCRL